MNFDAYTVSDVKELAKTIQPEGGSVVAKSPNFHTIIEKILLGESYDDIISWLKSQGEVMLKGSIHSYWQTSGLEKKFWELRRKFKDGLTKKKEEQTEDSKPVSVLEQIEKMLQELDQESSWSKERWVKFRNKVSTSIQLLTAREKLKEEEAEEEVKRESRFTPEDERILRKLMKKYTSDEGDFDQEGFDKELLESVTSGELYQLQLKGK